MSDIQLIDSHCHLIFENFENDLEDVVLRLRSRGVKKLVHACCELTEIPKLKKISHEFDEIYYSVGLHPLESKKWELSSKSILKKSRKVTNLPISIKLPRLLEIEYYDELIKATQEFDQVGVVLCNTLPVTDSRLSVGNGGRSGKSLFESTLSILKYVRKSFPEITILCSGGISSPDQAKMLLESGANALQIYTALIYEGPGIIKEINDSLSN